VNTKQTPVDLQCALQQDKSLWIYALRKPAKGGFMTRYACGHTLKSV